MLVHLSIRIKVKLRDILSNAKKKIFQFPITHWNRLNFTMLKNKLETCMKTKKIKNSIIPCFIIGMIWSFIFHWNIHSINLCKQNPSIWILPMIIFHKVLFGSTLISFMELNEWIFHWWWFWNSPFFLGSMVNSTKTQIWKRNYLHQLLIN